MVTSVVKPSQELTSICKRHGVKRLELFGSAARDDFDADRSDLDFLVEFLSNDWHGAADRWFGLIEDLESLYKRKIDLVDTTVPMSRYFQEKIQSDRLELYVA